MEDRNMLRNTATERGATGTPPTGEVSPKLRIGGKQLSKPSDSEEAAIDAAVAGLLSDLPFDYGDTTARPALAPPRRHRHQWVSTGEITSAGVVTSTSCERCGHPRNDAAVSRGRRSRRLGADQERRIERVYGPTKIGERGDPVDHLGSVFKWQSRATRAEMPAWLTEIGDQPVHIERPAMWITRPIEAMRGLYGLRLPLLVRSYVRPGVRPRDLLFLRAFDWAREHGPLLGHGVVAMTGQTFLDYHGRDQDHDIQPPDPYPESLR